MGRKHSEHIKLVELSVHHHDFLEAAKNLSLKGKMSQSSLRSLLRAEGTVEIVIINNQNVVKLQ